MKETISFTDFLKLDIRIGTITLAEKVEDTDKLIRLEVDLGEETRQLVAGLGEVIDDPQTLVGKQIPVLTNLEPKTMRGVESQGMILAADDEGLPILLHPEKEINNGSIVR